MADNKVRHELTHWRPRELVLNAVQQPLDQFATSCGSAFLLVVVLDTPHSELAQGLAALELTPAALGAGGESTLLEEAAGRHARPSLSRGWNSANVRIERPLDQIPEELRRVPSYVLSIRKRPEAGSLLQHVSIGRARNHDIVLRHPSVSKFHAWFEVQAEGQDVPSVFVKDAGSQNHTHVDGQLAVGRTQLQPGNTIRFGSVNCTLCTPEGLWTTMHA